MKKLIFQSGVLLLLLALMSAGHAQVPEDGERQYIPVFCDRGHSLQDAVAKARAGATLDVYGTCNESVRITKDRINIGAFFGQDATVIAPAGRAFTVSSADNVFIGHLNILNGAISIDFGASAHIKENDIINSTNFGIIVFGTSSANIDENTITNASNVGVHVVQNTGWAVHTYKVSPRVSQGS